MVLIASWYLSLSFSFCNNVRYSHDLFPFIIMCSDVTVMSEDTDTYLCNIVYTDKDKTAKNSSTISLVNNGTGKAHHQN